MAGNDKIQPKRKKPLGKRSDFKLNGDFAKGNTIGKNGRQLGVPNKRSFLRDQVAHAIESAGGQERIDRLAKRNFMAMLKLQASLEPKDINVSGATIQVVNLIMYREEPPKDWKPYDQEETADENGPSSGVGDT